MKRILRWLAIILGGAFAAFVVSWLFNMPPADTRGTWETEGYGLALDVGRSSIDVYQTSDLHCHRDMQIPAHLWLVDKIEGAQFVREGERLRITVAGTLNPIYADPIPTLPATCDETLPGDAQTTFDVMWDVMNTHYAHFDTHGVDWDARRALRPDGPLEDQALFDLMRQALAGLDDGHTYIGIDGETWSPSVPPDWYDDRYTVLNTTLAVVPDLSTLDERGLQVGWAAPGIGYVLISHMSPEGRIGQRDAEAATAAFAQVADYFAEAEGLIVDVRYNPGGSDDISLAYAGYFTDTEVPAFTKSTRTETGYTPPTTAMITPQALHLKMPTVVLTSRFTGSAAEIFTMAMRELPQVTVIGEPTSGGLSDILNFRLPNGWDLGLSHQVYLAIDGAAFERIGVPPDIAVPVDTTAAAAGRDPQLEAALAHLQP